MRKIILLTAFTVLAFASCEKKWDCTIITDMGESHSVSKYTFKGTKKEMKAFEQSGTINNSWYTQSTSCH